MFENKTPLDIDKMTLAQVIDMVQDTELGTGKEMVALTKILYTVLGYEMSNDVALAAASNPKAQLVISTAGGGKTTWAQVKAVMQKIRRKSRKYPNRKIDGEKILCLVYNNHNVLDIESKHSAMVSKLQAAPIEGLDIDDNICARTMHAFSDYWRREYTVAMDLVGYSLLENEEQSAKMMRRAIDLVFKMLAKEHSPLIKGIQPDKISEANMVSLYNLYQESLKPLDAFTENDRFVDLHLPFELIQKCFDRYNASKKISRKFDYSDVLVKFYELLKTNEKAKARVQSYYEYVIADEVQDFSPVMWEILSLMVDNGTPLVCIGDEDQEIYEFRGADLNQLLQFTTRFEGGEVYVLNINRRCSEAILNEARDVISRNTLRFGKKLLGCKSGGSVVYNPYNTKFGEMLSIVNTLRKRSPDSYPDTCICYRELKSSALIADFLAEAEIQFHTLRGYGAYGHNLYRYMFDALDIIAMPRNPGAFANLYRLLPCTKDALYRETGYNLAEKTFKNINLHGKHIGEIDYGSLMGIRGFTAALEVLVALSEKIKTAPLTEIVPPLFTLLNQYFWAFQKRCSEEPDLDEIMEERVLKFFSVDKTYEELLKWYRHKQDVANDSQTMKRGITLSTFHGLKGLEFDTVIVIDMNNEKFPNFGLIDSKPYTEDTKLHLKESETRLWYVVVTRAIKELIVYYDANDPSIYVTDALNSKRDGSSVTDDKSVVASDSKIITGIKVPSNTATREVTAFDNVLNTLQSMPDTATASYEETEKALVYDDIEDLFDDFETDYYDAVVPASSLPAEEYTAIKVQEPLNSVEDVPSDNKAEEDASNLVGVGSYLTGLINSL